MPSKKSFFNRTLFRKHLSRFWPLWGGVSLAGAMLPLYMQLALMQRTLGYLGGSGMFREALYQAVTGFVPAFTCAYAILCVMAVWGYLYNARSVGLMHTLPVDRTCLFVTNTLAALAMVLIPYAVVGGLICLIALGWGFFDLVAVLTTVLAVLLIALLFTGIASLCAMLTGHGLVLPVFYLLANFLAFAMEILITDLAHEFLLGVPMVEDLGRLGFLSPVVEIYQKFHVYAEWENSDLTVCYLQGLWVVALYALAGLAMLALSWLLYRLRHSESAGDVVAFRWLRPVFRYGVALLSGLTIGRLLYWLLWFGIFQRNEYADILPMAVCIFLAAVVGYYAASMLLEKSRRVFGKKSLPGVGIVAAGTIALCLLVSVDVFGLERKVPEPDEISSVSIRDGGIESGPFFPSEDPDQVEALLSLHRAIVDDRDYIRSYFPYYDYEEGQAFFHYVYLTYQMKDGSTLRRVYSLWLTRDRAETAGTYDSLLAEFHRDPAVIASEVMIPRGATLDSIEIYYSYGDNYSYNNTTDHAGGDDRETKQVYAALQKDAAEGNIPARDVLHWFDTDSVFRLELSYFMPSDSDRSYYSTWNSVYLAPSMTNTIDALVELEYVTPEEVEQWKQYLAEREAIERSQEVIYEEASAVPAE